MPTQRPSARPSTSVPVTATAVSPSTPSSAPTAPCSNNSTLSVTGGSTLTAPLLRSSTDSMMRTRLRGRQTLLQELEGTSTKGEQEDGAEAEVEEEQEVAQEAEEGAVVGLPGEAQDRHPLQAPTLVLVEIQPPLLPLMGRTLPLEVQEPQLTPDMEHQVIKRRILPIPLP